MRRSLWKSLLWQLVGLAFYLAGMLLFLFVAVDVYRSPPVNSIENLSSAHMGPILASLVLIVAGRLISWKLGGGLTVSEVYRGATQRGKPEQSQLEQLGYNVQPEESEESTSDVAYVDGEVYVVCRECGTQNEPDYSYCSECSSELPE